MHCTQEPSTSPSGIGHARRVAVVGGSGFYGRYLVADLLRSTSTQVLVISRRAPQRLHHTDRVRHGRAELRRLQVTTAPGLGFPTPPRRSRITRRIRPLGGRRLRTVTVYAVTSLTAA
jgi:hypothetical protein